jgi:hypothetical protein
MVRNWDGNFENNRTRKMKHMMWVPVPNKHDGDGYTELVDRENGAAMLGSWLAILQVASKCAERGTLVRDNGTPHTPHTISRLTRLDRSDIACALELLCSPEIGWLEVVDYQAVAPSCHPPAAESAPSCHTTDEEEKGIEGNRREEKLDADACETSGESENKQQQSKASPLPPKTNVTPPDFERCWVAYGRKGNKATALRYWKRLTEADKKAIEEKIAPYVASKDQKVFQKDFQGWINPTNRMWEDEIVKTQKPGSGGLDLNVF